MIRNSQLASFNTLSRAFSAGKITPQTRIAVHFKVYELVRSETAARHGIKNWFATPLHFINAVFIARNHGAHFRRINAGPWSFNSLYRSQALERALKGKPQSWRSRSQHAVGEAMDGECPRIDNLELAHDVQTYWQSCGTNPGFDQLILEFYDEDKGPNSGWIHLSSKLNFKGNRGKVLTYTGGRYFNGLPSLTEV